ncbi:sulfite exporter TauE/SafE family protein [Mesobacillus sp. AQ2]|uniref:sulfite exporter TauE/SafE family protein n=1 Tax=unclassified Mesobacillus TaxID=2675270 RepID=UPI00203BE17D|nr:MULTISPECIES: sulfite exporter TauE/SafE family protein [unclassified Mesobacillus]MCM3125682.1 sulfite exporter TauE/SafE family protein [Mesobacillus sp. MER 33]MCM3235703.1 sulfite exporter TauE/SafE family protein [Mesobacillus sp. MER 48]WHX40818.1 sulfite exporter TauE/SafE family protein [Mesobacillus sp. AQ2]
MEYIPFLLLGGLISVMSGFFGVGGGFILTPILLLIGFSPLEAITTSLFFTVGTSMSGIAAHIRMKNILWKEGLIMGLSGIVATQLARPIVYALEARGWDDIVIPFLYIVLLAYFAIKMIRQGKKKDGENPAPAHFSVPKLLAVGFVGGFVSASLGVGGGFIIVPLIITSLGFNPKKAVGTSLFAVLLIVSVGFISYAVNTQIDYFIGLMLIAGALVGAQFGARMTAYFENKEMNAMLGMLYIVTLAGAVLKLVDLNKTGLVLMGIFIVYFFVRAIGKIRAKAMEKG